MSDGNRVTSRDQARPFCKLGSQELRARIGQIRAELVENVVGVDELEQGYRFWVPKSEQNLRSLADFVEQESRCCPSFDFEIALRSGEDRVALALSGEKETKQWIEEMLRQANFELAEALGGP